MWTSVHLGSKGVHMTEMLLIPVQQAVRILWYGSIPCHGGRSAIGLVGLCYTYPPLTQIGH